MNLFCALPLEQRTRSPGHRTFDPMDLNVLYLANEAAGTLTGPPL